MCLRMFDVFVWKLLMMGCLCTYWRSGGHALPRGVQKLSTEALLPRLLPPLLLIYLYNYKVRPTN